ncbi:MAG: sugar-binding domain-containing protein [Limosilactobacillus pontis]
MVPGKDNPLEEVGIAGAHYIERIVKNNDVIGLAGEDGLSGCPSHYPKDVSGIKVVQMKGSMATPDAKLRLRDGQHLCQCLQYPASVLPVPVIFDHAKTKDGCQRYSYHTFLSWDSRLTLAMFTVGTVRDSALLFRLGYFTERERRFATRGSRGHFFPLYRCQGQIVNQ